MGLSLENGGVQDDSSENPPLAIEVMDRNNPAEYSKNQDERETTALRSAAGGQRQAYEPSDAYVKAEFFRMLIGLVFTIALAVFSFFTDLKVYRLLQESVLRTQGMPTANVAASILNNANTRYDSFVATFNLTNPTDVCNMTFFDKALGSEEGVDILSHIGKLESWSLVILILTGIILTIFLMYKCFQLVDYRSEWVFHKRRQARYQADGVTRNAFFVNPVQIKNNRESALSRRAKQSLGAESLLYTSVLIFNEAPQLVICIMYAVILSSSKGLKCFECINADSDCFTDESTWDKVPMEVWLSMIATSLSIVWNGLSLAVRWIKLKKDEANYFDEPTWRAGSMLTAVAVVFAFFSVIITPVCIVVYTFLGPTYLGTTQEEMLPLLVVIFVGSAWWLIALFIFGCIFANECSEACWESCAFCEICGECTEGCEMCCCCC